MIALAILVPYDGKHMTTIVDVIETEDGKPIFSANETKNNIEFYIKIFRMFAEQYSNVI